MCLHIGPQSCRSDGSDGRGDGRREAAGRSLTAWPALLGDAAGGPDVPVTAAPARLEDATDLPPAYIEVGQLDAFGDEDTAYATKLSRAVVPVEFHMRPGVPYEFDSIVFQPNVSRRAIADRIRVLKSI
jgi:acetyl esterase/lipase